MTAPEEIFAIATANRLLAADLLESLTEEQWATPSLCEGWTVREVAAHLVPPEKGFTLGFLLKAVIKNYGNLDRAVDSAAREGAKLPTAQIVGLLRERADMRLDPPVVRIGGPLSDTAIHLRDMARPLGSDVSPEPDTWRPVLDFLVSPPATRGFIPKDRVPGLRLETTDTDWSHGTGELVSGPAEAVALAVSGRAVALPDLEGPGAAVLAARLA